MNKIQKKAIIIFVISLIITINVMMYYWGARGFIKFMLLNSIIVTMGSFGIYGIEEVKKLDDNERLL